MPLLNGAISREKELLTCCARAVPRPEIAARIREVASGPLDWDYALAQAQEHSLVPLLERNLRAAAPGVVPPLCAARLETLARHNAKRCLALTTEVIRVVEMLECRGVAAVPYKGPLTAAQAYGDITARQFEDLDFILPHREVRAADAALRMLGYKPRFPWVHSSNGKRVAPGEYAYLNPARQTNLELHTEATLRHFPLPPRLHEFFARTVAIDLGGRSVRTFCPADALVVLSIHGAKDFWQKLIWIADIAALLDSFPPLDWDQVRRTTEELRAERMLRLGIALASSVADATTPPEISAAVKADAQAQNLAADVTNHVLGSGAQVRKALERFRFRRHMVDGGMFGWRYAMRLTLAPAEEDWHALQLPPTLSPVYVALRPFRLLRKYGGSRR
jgi:Uncharacterised nucleotidyltransferase